MTKTVLTNTMVAHVWAQQNPNWTHARSNNGNFSFSGVAIVSYRTTIAMFVKPDVVLITSDSFSHSTSGQQRLVEQALPDGLTRFYVPCLDQRNKHVVNVKYLARVVSKHLKESVTCRFLGKYGPAAFRTDTGGYLSHRSTVAEYPANASPIWRRNAIAELEKFRNYVKVFGQDAVVEFGVPSGQDIAAFAAPILAGLESSLDAATAAFTIRHDACFSSARVAKRAKDAVKREALALKKHRAEIEAQAAEATIAFDAWKAGTAQRPSANAFQLEDPRRAELVLAAQAEAAERDRIRNLADAERRDEWLAGTSHGYYSGYGSPVLLRVRNDTLETSRGASVPLAHAVRVFKAVVALRDPSKLGHEIVWQHNGRTMHVGAFQVDAILADGSFRAGCHFIQWPEIARLATTLGLLSTVAEHEQDGVDIGLGAFDPANTDSAD